MGAGAPIIIVAAVLLGITGLVLGIVGAAIYPGEAYDLETCYRPIVKVEYDTVEPPIETHISEWSGLTTYRSYFSAESEAQNLMASGTKTCWYVDQPGGAEPKVRFTLANPTPYLVLLCIGWPLLGVTIVGAVAFFFLIR